MRRWGGKRDWEKVKEGSIWWGVSQGRESWVMRGKAKWEEEKDGLQRRNRCMHRTKRKKNRNGEYEREIAREKKEANQFEDK